MTIQQYNYAKMSESEKKVAKLCEMLDKIYETPLQPYVVDSISYVLATHSMVNQARMIVQWVDEELMTEEEAEKRLACLISEEQRNPKK